MTEKLGQIQGNWDSEFELPGLHCITSICAKELIFQLHLKFRKHMEVTESFDVQRFCNMFMGQMAV